jgi:hypothetical protein
MATIKLYKLYREGNLVKWEAPNGKTYEINIESPPNIGSWTAIFDLPDNPYYHAMAYSPNAFGDNGIFTDGTLVVTMDRAARNSSVTLLHNADKLPRKYYFSFKPESGMMGGIPFLPPAFIIRAEGLKCPIEAGVSLYVMVVTP